MKDKYENLRKLQKQRYAIKRSIAPHEGSGHWVLIYTTKIEDSDNIDFYDNAMIHHTKEACLGHLLDCMRLGDEICWFNIIEAKEKVDTFYNIDHSDKEVREDFRHEMKNHAMITLIQEIEDYIADDIATEKWAEQGYRLDKEGYMIYEL